MSIEALAMAGADYVDCILELESALPPPHLLADDKEELCWKSQFIKRSSIPATSHQSKNVSYQSSESDPVLNEDDDLITTMNLSCRKDDGDEEVVDLSNKLLLKLISFGASFKKEKLESALASCCLSGERRNFCEKITLLGFIQWLEDTTSCF